MRGPLAIAVVAAALVAAACGGDEESPGSAAVEPAPGAGCRQEDPPRRRPDGGQPKPTERLDPSKTYEVVFATSCGKFTVRLDVRTSPRTTASFAALVRRRFFDGTGFHRIVPGFVIQGGDPTGTGRGGPGYSTVERPPRDVRYTAGVVAMAKTAAEPPGTAGSQFYVVTGNTKLPPEYALLGRVTSGLSVTRRIGELGDRASGGTGRPTQVVLIDSARLRTSGGGANRQGRGRLSCGPADACPRG